MLTGSLSDGHRLTIMDNYSLCKKTDENSFSYYNQSFLQESYRERILSACQLFETAPRLLFFLYFWYSKMQIMSENNDGFGMDILKGLKKVLFTSNPEQEMPATPSKTSPAVTRERIAEPSPSIPVVSSIDESSTRDMKLKVYQLLENMNKPGVDFFEVWNAAVEMGGASSANIKSAFTSLKFADKSLSKAKLLETGTAYLTGLKTVIETESQKRQEEKSRLNKEREQVKSSLVAEINALEQQIAVLQEKLSAKKSERDTIEDKYDPKIADIDIKISAGRQAVGQVMSEMQTVLDIINKELN